MKNMSLNEIRKRFLDFFESKSHEVEASFSLVPQNDKSLLLINAGMAPLKNYFMGIETPPNVRMATCQKCIRTGDIENVGRTSRHATFFEMLGNFSFGDYFKVESLQWGWEFITKDLELPVDLLWATVYEEDDEAYDIWKNVIGVPEDRIVRLGKKDNFWEIGTGPCGPCSEIYYDRGEKYGCGCDDCKPGCDCDRYIEFWNHVFTQFDRDENGVYHPLAKKNIDTGMGLERISCIVQEVDSIFEIDTIVHILNAVIAKAGQPYGVVAKTDVSMRIITDHIKAVAFLVCDGVIPNNEGRGYVLRRLLRRAARHGKLLGIQGNFLVDLVESVLEVYGEAYPDLVSRKDYIKKIISLEEERFQQTIDQGLSILNGHIDELLASGGTVLAGDKAFTLYDTYGFPFDLTVEILLEKQLSVDEDAFKKCMADQRDRARASRGDGDELGWEGDALSGLIVADETVFEGYQSMTVQARLLAIIHQGKVVDAAEADEHVIVLLDRTPFYPEGGGQVGDHGLVTGPNGTIRITETRKGNNGVIIHAGIVESGTVAMGDDVNASVDASRRLSTARNHTATHLVQKALRTVVGTHVEQSGSMVDPGRLRFDFTHFQGLTKDELVAVEMMVNEEIYKALTVETLNTSISEAKQMGAMALFGEKYGNEVRVVKAGDFSIELCGGTHVKNTSEIGMFKIVSETGVAAGVRRIEAMTGLNVYQYLNQCEEKLEKVAATLKTNAHDLLGRAEIVMAEAKDSQKQLESIKARQAGDASKSLLENAVEIKGIKLVSAVVPASDADGLKMMGDSIKERLEGAVVALGTECDGKALFVVMADEKAIAAGAHSGNMIREIAKVAEGGGGGKPNMAQAGGKNASKLGDAIAAAVSVLEGMLK